MPQDGGMQCLMSTSVGHPNMFLVQLLREFCEACLGDGSASAPVLYIQLSTTRLTSSPCHKNNDNTTASCRCWFVRTSSGSRLEECNAWRASVIYPCYLSSGARVCPPNFLPALTDHSVCLRPQRRKIAVPIVIALLRGKGWLLSN